MKYSIVLLLCIYACIVCQNWPETYEYSMNFHPIFGNHRKNYAFDCGSITYLNKKYLQFLDGLMDTLLSLGYKYVGSNPIPTHFFKLSVFHLNEKSVA